MKEKTQIQKALGSFFWFISVARNILVVVFSGLIAFMFEQHGYTPFVLTGYVKPGLPAFKPPPFSATVNNHTYDFIEMTSNLSSGMFVVPLLSILENIALAKAFCKYQTYFQSKRFYEYNFDPFL